MKYMFYCPQCKEKYFVSEQPRDCMIDMKGGWGKPRFLTSCVNCGSEYAAYEMCFPNDGYDETEIMDDINIGLEIWKRSQDKKSDRQVVNRIKILAIDQASIHSAYSVWNDSELIKYGTVTADKKIKTHLRIRQMSVGLMEIINEIEPDYVVFEDCQLQAGNAATFQVLCQLQGMLMDVLYNKGVQFDIVRPSVWKSFLGVAKGKRDEQKAKTLEKIEKKYEVELDGNDDIADAIGIGHYAINKLLAEV